MAWVRSPRLSSCPCPLHGSGPLCLRARKAIPCLPVSGWVSQGPPHPLLSVSGAEEPAPASCPSRIVFFLGVAGQCQRVLESSERFLQPREIAQARRSWVLLLCEERGA